MALEVSILTLAFDPLLEGFPNERLRDFLVGRELLSVDSFSFVQGGVPYWSLCITYRRLRGQDEPKNDDPKETVTPDAKARKDAFRDLLSELDERERVAYDRLRGWRRETAHEQGLAPYMICNDRALLELVRRRPRTKAGLLEVKGIGEKKVSAYGDAMLEVLHGQAIRSTRREAAPDSDQVAGLLIATRKGTTCREEGGQGVVAGSGVG